MSSRTAGHRWLRRILLLSLSAGVTVVLTAEIALSSGVQRSRAAGRETSAHVWITTADGTDKLPDSGTVRFGDEQPSAPTVVIDPSRSFQTMDGFGGAITDSSAVVLYRMSPAAREQAMRMLSEPRTGDGHSYLRQSVGASDFIA